MIQSTTTNILKWLAIAFLSALVSLMFFRNERLSDSVEALEAKIAMLQTTESELTVKPVEQIFVSEKPAGPVDEENTKDASAGSNTDQAYDTKNADNLAEITQALATGLFASGSLSESMDDLEQRFEEEVIDPGWSTQQMIEIQTEFASSEPLVGYNLSSVECRTTMCRGEVQSLGGLPYENYGASIAVTLTEFESVKLVKMEIQGDEATTAQVFFEKN